MAETLPEGTVTVLFTDVEGSTGLTTSRGDEGARDVLRAHEELVRQQVQEHGGREVKAIGDGFMVAFGSARKAVACAVGIQRALEENNRGQPAADQVRVRMGLNTGEVVREQDDLFGETVNAAARIGNLRPVDQAVEAMLAAPTAPWSIKRLASQYRVSREHLARIFRERVGLPPAAWQARERVRVAVELLERPGLPVRAVRDQAGFSSSHALIRHVRLATGLTPREIRLRYKGVLPNTEK